MFSLFTLKITAYKIFFQILSLIITGAMLLMTSLLIILSSISPQHLEAFQNILKPC